MIFFKMASDILWMDVIGYFPLSGSNGVLHRNDGLVQERRKSSALAMELRISCTNPSTWNVWASKYTIMHYCLLGKTANNMSDISAPIFALSVVITTLLQCADIWVLIIVKLKYPGNVVSLTIRQFHVEIVSYVKLYYIWTVQPEKYC